MTIDDAVNAAGIAIEVVGVAILVGGVAIRFVVALGRLRGGRGFEPVYRETRRGLGRVLLLGIEVLVAGDIIRTVAIEPTLTSVGVLAGIVLIRTFLSWSIELETEGHWPWRAGRQDRGQATRADEPDGGDAATGPGPSPRSSS